MQLGLDENKPPSGAVAEIEEAAELSEQHAGGARMREGRPRRGVELAVEHLGDEVLGHFAQIVVRGAYFERFRGQKLTPAAQRGTRSVESNAVRFERVNLESGR